MQHTEEQETENDMFIEGREYDVECVHCGHTRVMTATGECQDDTEEREYVGDGIYRIRKGNAAPTFCKRVPYLCEGCGQPMKATLKLR